MSDNAARRGAPLDEDEDDYGLYDGEDLDGPPAGEPLDDDDEEEDEDEEEDYRGGRKGSGKSRSRKKHKANPFLELEAEVDEDDEEDEEGYDDGHGDFIDQEDEEVPDTEDYLRTDLRRHRDYDRRLDQQTDTDLQQLAADIDRRHKRTVPQFRGDVSARPQHSLLPSVRDPKLWMVRCREGKERDLVLLVMRKHFFATPRDTPVRIHSIFCRDDLKGYIYVEADLAAHVTEALDKVTGVYLSRMTLVPVKEMADVLTIKKEDQAVDLAHKKWARIRRGKYAGDLVRIEDVADSGDKCTVSLVPRLDLTGSSSNADRDMAPTATPDRKRKKGGGAALAKAGIARPPQKLFEERDLPAHMVRKLSRDGRGFWALGPDRFRNGLLFKEVRATLLDFTGAPPTLDEIKMFSSTDGSIDALTLRSLKSALDDRDKDTSVFYPGDQVEVKSGELAGVPAVIVSVSGAVATIAPQIAGAARDTQTSVPVDQLRKRFSVGNTVRVLVGKHRGKIGTVVHVEGTTATLLVTSENAEIQVFTRDLQDAKDVTITEQAPSTGGPEGERQLAKIEAAPIVVGATARGMSMPTMPGQKSTMGPPRAPPPPRAGALGQGARRRDQLLGSTVKVTQGPYKGYMGVVKSTSPDGNVKVELHTNSKVVTVHREKLRVRDASGTFVGPSYGPTGTPHYGSAYGAAPGMYGAPGGGRTPNYGGGRTPNPYASAQTPNPYASAQTPNPYASGGAFDPDGGRTPAWDAGSRTPYRPAGGNDDAAWNTGSRTPAWGGAGSSSAAYDGGYHNNDYRGYGSSAPPPPSGYGSSSTPAYVPSGAGPSSHSQAPTPMGFNAGPTPNLYAPTPSMHVGSATPSYPGMAATPMHVPHGAATPAYAPGGAAAAAADDEPLGDAWAREGVVVEANPTALHGAVPYGVEMYIARAVGDGTRADVAEVATGRVVQENVPVSALKPVAPSKNDAIVVLAATRVGERGQLIAVHGGGVQGIVRMPGGTDFTILKMAHLGKLHNASA
ncbi:transcription elongation factor spt5 [Allomyces arbusculus]|nr:transcription elongation factor spt5 [Allomyces arbusculus]